MTTRKGFTLVEVMLSVGLIAVALLAVVGVFIAGLPLMRQNREVSTATSLARSLHEQIRAAGGVPKAAQNFQGSVPNPAVNGFPPPPYPAVTVAGVPYTFKVTVLPIPTRSDLMAVEVEVDWGQDHHLSLQSKYYVP